MSVCAGFGSDRESSAVAVADCVRLCAQSAGEQGSDAVALHKTRAKADLAAADFAVATRARESGYSRRFSRGSRRNHSQPFEWRRSHLGAPDAGAEAPAGRKSFSVAEARQEVTYFAENYRRSRSDKTKATYLDEWHWEKRMLDIRNDIFPPRYKTKLSNRSYRGGLMRRHGTARTRGNRELRDEYVGD